MEETMTDFIPECPKTFRHYTGWTGALHYANYILQKIAAPKDGKILDLGCGEGAVTAAMVELRQDLQIVGLDSVEECIRSARETYAKNPSIRFQVCDLREDLPELGTFDRVFSFSVAQYLSSEELLGLNKKIQPVLAAEGKIAHLSIPDLRKRPLLFADDAMNRGKWSPALVMFLIFKMLMVDWKRRLVGDRRYGNSLFHDAEELCALHNAEFLCEVNRPSDSWYRFDFLLRKKS